MGRVRDLLVNNKKNLIIASIAIVGFLLISIIVFNVLCSARLYLMVAPNEGVTVTVNGKEYKNGLHKIFVGHKKIQISGDGIETETIELNMGVFSNEAVLRAYAPNGNFSAYKQNGNDYIILKHYNAVSEDESMSEFVNYMEHAYSLKNELPYNNNFYNSFGRVVNSEITDATNEEGCKALICLRLDKDTDFAREETRKNLELNGYNMDDYVFFYGPREGKDEE